MSSLGGSLAIATGGTFIAFSVLSYLQMMYDGRLSYVYQNAAQGMLMMVCLFVFLGLLIASMGLQLILQENK